MRTYFDTLFLDRDGVINVKIDNEYIVKYSDFEFIPGVLSAIQKLSSIFKRIIIVTNQQGIGKKLMTEQDLLYLHEKMLIEIEQVGGKIDRIYYCPHLASANCECRKPKSGMIIQAIEDFPSIDSEFSYLIGDSSCCCPCLPGIYRFPRLMEKIGIAKLTLLEMMVLVIFQMDAWMLREMQK